VTYITESGGSDWDCESSDAAAGEVLVRVFVVVFVVTSIIIIIIIIVIIIIIITIASPHRICIITTHLQIKECVLLLQRLSTGAGVTQVWAPHFLSIYFPILFFIMYFLIIHFPMLLFNMHFP